MSGRLTLGGVMNVTKKERLKLLQNVKPQTWYYFSLVEAMYPAEVEINKVKMASDLNISQPTLDKYMAVWEGHGLVKKRPHGFVIAQLDGQESGVVQTLQPRKFNTSKSVIELWCKLYFEHYGEHYKISNWAVAQKQVKTLLVYSDEEIEGAIYVAITQYQAKWFTNPRYPRPTLGALTSWLFQQALPFVDKGVAITTSNATPDGDDLLAELEAKGWL